tara:strand:+ start:801 stop:1169 length:369 start_codon:yes stop_codon:yes gene_type:complete
MKNLTEQNAHYVITDLVEFKESMKKYFDIVSHDDLHAENSHLLKGIPVDLAKTIEDLETFIDKVQVKIDKHFKNKALAEEKKSVLELITESSSYLVESNKIDTREMLKAIAAKCEHLITTDF